MTMLLKNDKKVGQVASQQSKKSNKNTYYQAKLTKQQLGYVSRQNSIKKEMTILLKNNQKVGKVANQQSKKKSNKNTLYYLI